MTDPSCTGKNERLTLKEPTGWFAAGDGFRKALTSLSDGAFRLFAFLCLEADRHTGRHEATQRELAGALGKSKRIIGSYVAELEAKGICTVRPGKNQFARTVFEITDRYWPYHRREETAELPEQDAYVASVREYFLALGCATGKFGIADERVARGMQERGIPLAVIQDAMLMGACRKYSSWFEGRALEPIQSLRYFDQLITEIRQKPFPPGYSAYLRRKINQFAELWNESLKSARQAGGGGGCQATPLQENA
jgi:DNA-binding MarR family transcriptional regulator